MISLLREGASEGTVGSLYFYIIFCKFNEIISGIPKKSGKEMGSLFKNGHFKNVHFSKCDY